MEIPFASVQMMETRLKTALSTGQGLKRGLIQDGDGSGMSSKNHATPIFEFLVFQTFNASTSAMELLKRLQ